MGVLKQHGSALARDLIVALSGWRIERERERERMVSGPFFREERERRARCWVVTSMCGDAQASELALVVLLLLAFYAEREKCSDTDVIASLVLSLG